MRIDSAMATKFLRAALRSGNPTALRLLIDLGGAVEARDEQGDTPLLYLCCTLKNHVSMAPAWELERRHQQYFECLDLLLQKGANPNAADERGFTPLHLLAQDGETAGMQRLLEAGADVQATDRYGRTVLHVCKAPDAASVCIDAGLTVAVRDHCGYTPLDYATMYGNSELTEYLSQRDPSVQLSPSAALVGACLRGDVAEVRRMLAEGLPITTADSNGHSLLHIAARMCHTEMVEALLDSGADVNTRDQKGATALYHALNWFPSNRDPNGRMWDDFVRLVTMLLDRGAAPADIDGRSTSAAYQGIMAWFTPVLAKRLIDISPPVPKRDGATLTMLAARSGEVDLVRYTLRLGEDVNATDAEGKTALFYPVSEECEDVYKILLGAGTKVNVQDHSGNTALMNAVNYKLWSGIQLLLDHGADPTLANNAGQTALHKAIKAGNLDLFRLLKDRGQLS